MGNPKDFIDEWNQSKAQLYRIRMRPEFSGDCLFGVEFRFNGQSYNTDEEEFASICNQIFRTSKSTMQVTTDVDDFRSGILHIAVLFYNHGYNPDQVCKTLEIITEVAFPNIRK